LVLGLILGAGAALLREQMANRIRSSRELESLTGQAVLAQVPRVPERQRRKVLDHLGRNPTSAAAEAIRNLRTSILLSSADRPPKVIVITSSVPGEGKSTTTLALAQNVAAMGRSVLVIEGDVRQSRFAEYLGELPAGAPGIAQVIADGLPVDQALRRLHGGVQVLPGSRAAMNAADLFASERFGKLMADLRGRFDMILIDTPPVLVVPDARLIAQHADMVVFAVRWDMTGRGQIVEALHQLELVNVRVGGLVLTQVDPQGMRRYGYGDSYGAYAKYAKGYYGAE
jgi:capsular exopolysaccharide synthesis family protein